MASIFSAVGDFLKSIYELIASMFQTFFGLLNTLLTMIVNFFTGIVQLIGDTFGAAFSAVGGIGHFIIANAAVIGFVAVGVYAYLVYQRRQGKPVTVNGKKLN